MKPVLLDTGVIVAALDRSEKHHKKCAEALKNATGPLVTCEAVITEACYLVRNMSGASKAILDNVSAGNFQIPYHLSLYSNELIQSMKKYAKVPMDLADACLVSLASHLRVAEILTLDSDFLIYRWGQNRAFKVSPKVGTIKKEHKRIR